MRDRLWLDWPGRITQPVKTWDDPIRFDFYTVLSITTYATVSFCLFFSIHLSSSCYVTTNISLCFSVWVSIGMRDEVLCPFWFCPEVVCFVFLYFIFFYLPGSEDTRETHEWQIGRGIQHTHTQTQEDRACWKRMVIAVQLVNTLVTSQNNKRQFNGELCTIPSIRWWKESSKCDWTGESTGQQRA